MKITKNASLKSFNTFGIEAIAHQLIQIQNVKDIQYCVSKGWLAKEIESLVLGGGSNMLFTRDLPFEVIKIEIDGLEQIADDNGHVLVKVGAGVVWNSLVEWAVENNLSGIENLVLIPGTCGAAPVQNIGAYGVELCDVFHSLEAVHRVTGTLRTFDLQACEFSYRQSVFKKELKNQYIISSITLRLGKSFTPNLSYGALRDRINLAICKPTIAEVSREVAAIRNEKLPDPVQIGNAGSFFKNPIISLADFERIQGMFPDVPHFVGKENSIKIPAGWLIEQCGLKGYRQNQAGIHERQALVIVNYGGATGKDILNLSHMVQDTVYAKFGIVLEPEVNII
ncbi:MAG: UDP-N-acetylmuramate dehydrogenase [Cyclobacteriaceae bacterium]